MKKVSTYTSWQFVQEVAHFVSPYKWTFISGAALRLSSDVTRLYPAYALSIIIPLLGKLNDQTTLHTIFLLLFFWFLSALWIGIGQEVAKNLGNQVAERAGLDLYEQCLAHIFKLDLAWQELEGSGNKMKKIDRGHDGMNESIRRVFDVIIEVIVNTIGIVLIFFSLDKVLSMSIIFFIITYFLIGRQLLKQASRQEQIVNTKFEELSGLTFESLNNILTIKSLAFDGTLVHYVGQQAKALYEEIRKRIFYYRLQSGVLNVYFRVFEAWIISFIIWGIINGHYTVSLLVLFVGLFQKVGESTNELVSVTQQMVVNKIWLSRATDLLRVVPLIENPLHKVKVLQYPQNWRTLRIANVHFAYKKGHALAAIDFSIRRGESVGIVGLSGAGKSTLFKLLLDLYEDYTGDILLDDVPLKNIDRQLYINHVSIVLQDTELFNMTLGENITIANVPEKNSSKDVLQETIRMAHLKDVVDHLDNGVDTIVGEKGVRLSGGQRQRVGIARALFRQPDILLLDEATSHLDAYSEKQIQQAISEVKGKYTTIVIAHRLSTIQLMDKIVVLEKGRVKEIGTFDELIRLDAHFAKMWKMQKL